MNSLRIEGQKTVGMEIVQQRSWQVPDWLVIPGGNLGNVSALHKEPESSYANSASLIAYRALPAPKPLQANPLYTAYHNNWQLEPITAGETQAFSAIRIGSPVSAPKAIRALQTVDGVVEQATEQEIADACVEQTCEGAFTCPHTGVMAVKKLRQANVITASDDVVVISTAHGLKFGNVKAAYHADQLPGVDCHQRNEAVHLPATTAAVCTAVEKHRESMA